MNSFGFIGPTYQSASLNADAERSVNLYPEMIESGAGKNKMALLGTPGLTPFGTLATSPVRGLWAGGAPLTTGPRLFAVAGSKSYEVSSGGAGTLLGDVGNDGTPAQMFPNGNQLGTVSAGIFWIDNGAGPVSIKFTLGRGAVNTVGAAVTRVSGDVFNAGMVGGAFVLGGTGYSGGTSYTVLSVTDESHLTLTSSPGTLTGAVYNAPTVDTVTARTGAFLDGYFIVQKPDSKQWNISALNDGTKWNPLDFAIKEGYPDNIGSLLADHEELWIFGEETTEVWRNTGAANFPFERDPGAFIHQGIAAPWTAVRLMNGVAWVGSDSRGNAIAWRAQGFVPVRVSTHAVEQAWSGYSTITDATAYTYEETGHQFWVINFPTASATWVYDATEGMWHERGFWNGSAIARQRGNNHAFVFGKHLVGDYSTGVIYQSSSTAYDDAGTAIHRIRTAPHVSDEDAWTFFSRFRLDAENTGALNPSLDWSVDGGHTFNTPRTTASNAAGVFARYDWRRLGRSRDRVFRITITAAVKVALIDAYLDAEKGLR